MKKKELSIAALLWALVSASGLLSAQDNATSSLMTSGDIIGGTITIEMSDLTPSSNVYVLASLSLANPPGNFFLRDTYATNDDHDVLAISGGPSFAAVIPGTSTAGGTFSFTAAIPGTLPLDIKVYFQGLTQHAAAGANLFQDFSNLRVATMNTSNRWQFACTNLPVASSNLAFVVTETGPNGGATKILTSGGGPVLLSNGTVPYPTFDEVWEYDVAKEEHNLLANRMNVSRAFHTMTQLEDKRILICGGVTDGMGQQPPYPVDVLKSAEIYDPATGVFTQLPDMDEYRAGHTATLITTGVHAGKVLVAGGTVGDLNTHQIDEEGDLFGTEVATTELFDPLTNTFSAGPDMHEPKAGAGAVSLADGRIMIAGGITWVVIIPPIRIPFFSDRASFYNPTSNSFNTEIGMRDARALFGITELQNGNFLLAGGAGGDILSIGPLADAEVFNPGNFTFTATTNMPNEAAFPGIVTLANGLAVVVGGAENTIADPIPIADVNAWDSVTGLWTSLADLNVDHAGGVVALLEDGTIYSGGGESNAGVAVYTVETYSP